MRMWVAALAMSCALPAGAAAQGSYPAKPVTIVVPASPGGVTDMLGRTLAQRFTRAWGQQAVVENKPGANNQIAAEHVTNAAPDGYNFVLGTVGTHAQGQTLYKKPLYNAAADFTPVALLAEVPIIVVARKDLPVNNFKVTGSISA